MKGREEKKMANSHAWMNWRRNGDVPSFPSFWKTHLESGNQEFESLTLPSFVRSSAARA